MSARRMLGGVLGGVARSLLGIAGIGMLMLGLMKLTDIDSFMAAVEAHELLPPWSVQGVGWLTPVAEIFLGGAILWAMTTSTRASAFASLALSFFMLSMAVYAAGLWISPPPEPTSCGCMPSAAAVDSWRSVTLRNGLLTSAAAIIARVLIGISVKPEHPAPVRA